MANERDTKKAPRRRCAPRGSTTRRQHRASGAKSERWYSVFVAARQLLMAALDLAETAVVHVPEERDKVRRVRAHVEARCAGAKPPTVDARDIAFTIGLVADLAGSDFEQPGISALLVELLPLPQLRADARSADERGAAAAKHRVHGRATQPAGVCRLCLDEYQF